MAKFFSVKCPKCGEVIEVDLYDEVGDIITCFECDSELEIVSKNPVKLKVAKRAELDIDDDLIEGNDSDVDSDNDENENESWG